MIIKCPCGSNETFDQCCNPYIQHKKLPETSEQLMRSRYSAYATQHFPYVLATYVKAQRSQLTLAELSADADSQKWVGLTVHEVDSSFSPASVRFTAKYIVDNDLYELSEYSRFTFEDGAIRYQDGDILSHRKIATLKRNDPCPCLSGKKFKKCCALSSR